MTTSNRLKDRIAIVTGASSGIGRAISLAYAREGATVVVGDLVPNSRNPNEAEATTVETIQKTYNGTAEFIKTDVTDSKSVDALVEAVVQKYGRLDIMVNNAGIGPEATQPAPVWETTDEMWHKTLNINCHGVFYGVRAAGRQMVKQEPYPNGDRGWIINLASVFSLVGTPSAPSYVASKFLVNGLTKTAALDLAPYRVHCNSIHPGYVQSAFTAELMSDPEIKAYTESLHPFRGLGWPEDVAGIAIFLASEDARWMTGSSVVADGGYTAR